MTLIRRAVFCFVLAWPAVAQPFAFAAVTITQARGGNEHVQLRPSGEWTASAVSVSRLLSFAYGLPGNGSARLSALPNWTLVEKYDIEAKVPANAISGLQDSEVRKRIQQMIGRLLVDRFGLMMRVENKTMPVYALTVARGGAKLLTSTISERECIFDIGPEPCHSFAGGLGHPLNGGAIDMDDVARYIENWTDLPVVNRTAVSGRFALDTDGWVPMRLPPPPPGFTPAGDPFAGLPTIFTVLGKLGLELTRREDVLPVYTVDRVEHPATN